MDWIVTLICLLVPISIVYNTYIIGRSWANKRLEAATFKQGGGHFKMVKLPFHSSSTPTFSPVSSLHRQILLDRPYAAGKRLSSISRPLLDSPLCQLPTPMSLTIHHRSVRQKLDAKVGILLTAAIGVSSPMSAAGTPPPSFYPLTWPPCYGGSIFAGPRRFRGRDHGRQKFEIFRLPPFGANLGQLVYWSPA